jgi:hypothetical protein
MLEIKRDCLINHAATLRSARELKVDRSINAGEKPQQITSGFKLSFLNLTRACHGDNSGQGCDGDRKEKKDSVY